MDKKNQYDVERISLQDSTIVEKDGSKDGSYWRFNQKKT